MPNVEASKANRIRRAAEPPAPVLTADPPLCSEQAFERFLEPVFRYVSRRVPRREEAEDITAEVFIVLAQSGPRTAGEAALYLWLLGIARRKIADSLRQRQRRPEMLAADLPPAALGGDAGAPRANGGLEELADASGSPEDRVIRAERRRVVRELMDELPPDQREALLLKYVEGLPIAAVAGLMGRSPAAVNSLLQRARAAFYRRGQAYFLECGANDE